MNVNLTMLLFLQCVVDRFRLRLDREFSDHSTTTRPEPRLPFHQLPDGKGAALFHNLSPVLNQNLVALEQRCDVLQ